MGLHLRFTDQDWGRIERDWSAWWAGELGRPLVVLEAGAARPREELSQPFLFELPVDRVLDHVEAQLEKTRYFGDAWPKWWPNFGPGIAAGFLGARVNCAPDEETVWFEPAEQVALAALRVVKRNDNPWWRRVRELTAAAVDRWGDQVAVAHTDLGGNLDILASLCTTQRLLYELHDAPDQVAWLVGEITRLWLDYYEELYAIIRRSGRGTTPWAAIWSPARCYMLQSDFAYMISPQMFERFVLPDLAACCEALDHSFYHLDGIGQIRHLDMLLSLDRLRGIQWVPGDGQPPPEAWLPLLERIRRAGRLCQLAVTPEGAQTIVRHLGGRGFAFHIEQPMSEGDALDLVRGLGCPEG